MKAFVTIHNFGTTQEKLNLCDSITHVTSGAFGATLEEGGHVMITCHVNELGTLFAQLADNVLTDWIEYTVQFAF